MNPQSLARAERAGCGAGGAARCPSADARTPRGTQRFVCLGSLLFFEAKTSYSTLGWGRGGGGRSIFPSHLPDP
eukprot:2893584-Pyramimonas_sp.AAC.1